VHFPALKSICAPADSTFPIESRQFGASGAKMTLLRVIGIDEFPTFELRITVPQPAASIVSPTPCIGIFEGVIDLNI